MAEQAQQRLFSAAGQGDLEQVRSLLDKGVDPCCGALLERAQNSALHSAVRRHRKEAVQELLARGAKNLPNSKGFTPLHYAAIEGSSEFIDAILDACPDADIDYQNCRGDTALHRSAANRFEEASATLVGRGASNDVLNDDGKRPSELAPANSLKLVAILEEGTLPAKSAAKVC
eukprot:m.77576 g.77576  ORF g.77576 m.77576 type:complete len:174 (-) comp14552_c0_seq5:189-710(-)